MYSVGITEGRVPFPFTVIVILSGLTMANVAFVAVGIL